MKSKTKVCKRCKKRKPLKRFRVFAGSLRWCIPCTDEYNHEYTKKNRVALTEQKRRKRFAEPWDVLRSAWRAARHRHIDGVQFTFIDLKNIYIKQRGKCALSGITMTWANGTKIPMPTSISIDRINCKGGYTKKNVRLVCYSINSFRQSMSDSEMVVMANAIVAHARKRR